MLRKMVYAILLLRALRARERGDFNKAHRLVISAGYWAKDLSLKYRTLRAYLAVLAEKIDDAIRNLEEVLPSLTRDSHFSGGRVLNADEWIWVGCFSRYLHQIAGGDDKIILKFAAEFNAQHLADIDIGKIDNHMARLFPTTLYERILLCMTALDDHPGKSGS